jgi:hypothetical protein
MTYPKRVIQNQPTLHIIIGHFSPFLISHLEQLFSHFYPNDKQTSFFCLPGKKTESFGAKPAMTVHKTSSGFESTHLLRWRAYQLKTQIAPYPPS